MVPAGKAREVSDATGKVVECKLIIKSWNGIAFPFSTGVDWSWPQIKFRQGTSDTCMFDSFASALSYLNLKNTAMMIHHQAKNSLKRQENSEKFSFLDELLQQYEPWLAMLKLRYNLGRLDIMNNRSLSPTVAILQSMDGACNHAVTLVGDWIFDASKEKALPISEESLNRCAPTGFVTVVYAVRYGKQ